MILAMGAHVDLETAHSDVKLRPDARVLVFLYSYFVIGRCLLALLGLVDVHLFSVVRRSKRNFILQTKRQRMKMQPLTKIGSVFPSWRKEELYWNDQAVMVLAGVSTKHLTASVG